MTIFTTKSFVATANAFQEYKRNLKDVRTKSPDIFVSQHSLTPNI